MTIEFKHLFILPSSQLPSVTERVQKSYKNVSVLIRNPGKTLLKIQQYFFQEKNEHKPKILETLKPKLNKIYYEYSTNVLKCIQ